MTHHEPIRVAYLIDRLAPAGTERQLLGLVERLDRARVRPYLCLLDGHDPQSRGLEPAEVPVLRLGVSTFKRPWAWRQAAAFFRFLRRERIEVLQLHFPDSTYFGAPLGWLAGARVIRTRRDLGYWVTGKDRVLGRLWNRLFVDATVANCQAARAAFLRDERPRPETVRVIDNGVDLAGFRPRSIEQAPAVGGRQRVVLVANLRPVKAPQVFVEAALELVERFPRAEFLLAGQGPLAEELARQVAAAGRGERIRLLGSVDDVPGLLAETNVAVLSSASEGLSNAVIEYMAAGCAIVATNVGGTAELLDEGRTGLLVPAGDPSALAARIGELLADPARAARLGQAARADARARFAWPAVCRRYEDLYAQVTGRTFAPLEREATVEEGAETSVVEPVDGAATIGPRVETLVG